MTPALNKTLPEFEAKATGGVTFTPQAYLGQTVVLYRSEERRVGKEC